MSSATGVDVYPPTDFPTPNGTLLSSAAWTDGGTDAPPHHNISQAEKIIEALLLSLICIVAFSGNVLLWFVVVRNKTLRTTSNALVLCLSCADILVSVVNMPITIFTILHGDQFFADGLCVVLGFANMTFFIASVMSLAAISLNRYVLIVHPKRFKTMYTIRNTGLVILVVWLLSLSLATPPLLGWARYAYLPGQSFCFCYWEDSISYTFFMVFVCFGGPCSIMTFCYYNILREVRRSRKRLAMGPGSADASSMNSAQSAFSAMSNNNSGLRRGNGEKAGTRTSPQNLNGSFKESDKEDLEQMRKGRMAALIAAVNKEISKRRPRVDPTSPAEGMDNPGLKTDGSKPIPTGIAPCEITDEPSPQQISNSPSRKGSRYLSQNQPATTSKTPRICLQEFSRSTSMDSRRGSVASLIGRAKNESEGGGKPTRSSPKRSGMVKQLSGSLLAVPGLRNAPGIRRKRAKTLSEMRRKQEELKLTKSFLVVVLVFIICWFPFCITMFWSVFSPDPVFRPADMTSLLLGFFNSCCNPIIYGVMNTRFRAGFKHILCCHWAPYIRSRVPRSVPDRSFGSNTNNDGTTGGAYNDDISFTA